MTDEEFEAIVNDIFTTAEMVNKLDENSTKEDLIKLLAKLDGLQTQTKEMIDEVGGERAQAFHLLFQNTLQTLEETIRQFDLSE